jgi:DNA modification methylase
MNRQPSDHEQARARSPRGVRDRVVELRRVRAGDLLEHPRNWRRHPEHQRRALRALLREVGYAAALIAREEEGRLMLVDGHLRRSIDPDQIVPVLVLDVTEEEADKLLATLDPISALARPDPERLQDLLGRVATSSAAVRELLAAVARGAHLPVRPGLTHPDAAPPLPEVPTAKPGDLWLLGEHRVLCGDATEGADVARLLDGERPALTVTDPPYGVGYDPAWRARAAERGALSYAARRLGTVPGDDRSDWRAAWALVPGDVLYCWHAGREAASVQEGLEASGFSVRSQIIWSKPHVPISRGHYHWRHEPCWYAVRKGASAHWSGDRTQTTVWEIVLDQNVAGGHSTQKPVEAMERPIRNHDAPIVYDPFLGSGTTLVAAERVGRRCLGMEIDPGYVDVAVTRWERYTGHRAHLA